MRRRAGTLHCHWNDVISRGGGDANRPWYTRSCDALRVTAQCYSSNAAKYQLPQSQLRIALRYSTQMLTTLRTRTYVAATYFNELIRDISILSPGQGLRTRAKRTTGKQGLRYTVFLATAASLCASLTTAASRHPSAPGAERALVLGRENCALNAIETVPPRARVLVRVF